MWEEGVKGKIQENLCNQEVLKTNVLLWDAMAFLQHLLLNQSAQCRDTILSSCFLDIPLSSSRLSLFSSPCPFSPLYPLRIPFSNFSYHLFSSSKMTSCIPTALSNVYTNRLNKTKNACILTGRECMYESLFLPVWL